MVNREIETKTDRIVELLDRQKLGGVLLNAQHNFSWMTGGASNGIDQSRENGAATIFIRRDRKRFLLANNIEMTRMFAEEISADSFEPIEFTWQDEKASGNVLIEKARSLSDGQIASDVPINASLRSIESQIAQCRFELLADEVVRYRKLGAATAKAFGEAIATIKPGMTEIEIASDMRQKLGTTNIMSVVTLVAADERISKYRHPVPTENRWRQTLLLVTCAKRNGLIASLSRLIRHGRVPRELQERTEAAAFVNASLWNATRPGITGAELYEIAAEAYASVGYSEEINKHHQGGAAGYKTREWVAHPQSVEVVMANQAFAWNPSVTGTKIEETCIAGERGLEVITASNEFPVITTTIDGREFGSPGILEI